jgi:hypothetical protein
MTSNALDIELTMERERILTEQKKNEGMRKPIELFARWSLPQETVQCEEQGERNLSKKR